MMELTFEFEIEKSHMDGDVKVIDQARIVSVSPKRDGTPKEALFLLREAYIKNDHNFWVNTWRTVNRMEAEHYGSSRTP